MAVEVVDVDTLLAHAQEKERSAATELEDAKLAKARIEEEITTTGNAIAWMTSNKFAADDVAKAVAVREAEKLQLAAADAKISACDQAVADAAAYVTMAARHVQIKQQNAAGQPYK